MKITFTLSLLVITFALGIYFLFLEKKKNIKLNISVGVITCIIAITILMFPFMEYSNPYTNAFASFIYATDCIGLGQDLGILAKISLDTPLSYLYFILLNFLFLALPSLTIGFVITYLEKIVSYIKLKKSQNKKICVFSEINDKSMIVAKNIEKSCTIIFANVKDKVELDIKAIKLNKKITDINFSDKTDVTFYMIYQNEEMNLSETLELIHKYKDREKTKIYVVSGEEEAPIILDSTDKGIIDVEIINENERRIFNLLNDKPLFLNAINDTISILIVGCGNIGKEFLKDSLWCGMIPNYKFKILVIDLLADQIKEDFMVSAPELLDNYDITFVNLDIKTKKAMDIIKSREDINYILVSMDNDEKNINTAILLRRFFLREFKREPIINIYVDNNYKQEQILSLSNEKNQTYNLNAFGGNTNLYKEFDASGTELEKLAKQVHLAYDPKDHELKRYNLREYNKRSSRACALHFKYKLYAILKEQYTNNFKDDLKNFRKIYSKEIEEMLSRSEHDRWMAYMRSIGYVYVNTSEVQKYYEKNKHYIDYLARRHPALVSYDELDNISKKISKIIEKEIDFKESDTMIIKYLYESIDL